MNFKDYLRTRQELWKFNFLEFFAFAEWECYAIFQSFISWVQPIHKLLIKSCKISIWWYENNIFSNFQFKKNYVFYFFLFRFFANHSDLPLPLYRKKLILVLLLLVLVFTQKKRQQSFAVCSHCSQLCLHYFIRLKFDNPRFVQFNPQTSIFIFKFKALQALNYVFEDMYIFLFLMYTVFFQVFSFKFFIYKN